MMHYPILLLMLALCYLRLPHVAAFAPIHRRMGLKKSTSRGRVATILQATTNANVRSSPIFDFSQSNTAEEFFERIDDAIMGGVSTSSIRDVPDQPYAIWSGICRVDGGGFCGTRTVPFKEPLQVGDNAEGFYLDCRLTSDDEPERRIWKVSTRTEASRGEELYQCQFEIPKKNKSNSDDWIRVQLPFDNFTRVRGARLVQGASPMDVFSGGIYQIGLTLSKFTNSQNMTEIDNFRSGYFELQLKELGLFSKDAPVSVGLPSTMSKEEVQRKRPLVLKVLLPFSRLFFSEKGNRRRVAMKLLREKRGLNRAQAILFGIKTRAAKSGLLLSFCQAIGIIAVDCFRTFSSYLIRYGLVLPLVFITRTLRLLKAPFSGKKQVKVAES